MAHDKEEMRALVYAARQAGVSAEELIEYVQRRIIILRENRWDAEAIETARRVRRLRRLGVNMPGIEVIMHMREQMIRLQRELDRLQEEMRRAREDHEREIARLLRQRALDLDE